MKKKELETADTRRNIKQIKKEDREETAKRMAKMEEHKKKQILDRIAADNEKARKIQEEKQALLQARKMARIQIDQEKAKALADFERMKKTGKINVPYTFL